MSSSNGRVGFYCLLVSAIVWLILVTSFMIVYVPSIMFLYPFAVIVIASIISWAILGIPAFVCIGVGVWLRRRRERAPMAPIIPPRPVASRPVPEVQPVVREREIREVVLVVCPYCGTKNQQGTTHCSKCGASI
ncbi:MAG: zinc ribbon domain-containing protein [Promethearchaeota archaeon]